MDDLSGAKAGDKIYVYGSYGVGRIATVDRITPSGRVIAGNQIFDPSGRLRGRDTWSRVRAVIATQDHLDRAEQDALADKLHRLDWHTLPLALLRQVKAVLAQGTEARRVETPLAAPSRSDDGPVAEGDAP